MKHDDYCYLNPIDLQFNFYTGPERIVIYTELVLLDPRILVELVAMEGEDYGSS